MFKSPLSSRYSSTLRPSAAVCSCQLWIWCRHSGQLHHCPGAAVQHRQEQQCNTVQEQQCKTVQDTVNEQVCESVQEQECNTVYDEVCDSAQPTYRSGGFGGSARGSGSSSSGASSGYGAASAPACRQVARQGKSANKSPDKLAPMFPDRNTRELC